MNSAPPNLSLTELRVPVADVVTKYFGGDSEFFDAYQASCSAQFPVDLQAGQSACAASDMDALVRTAHNLKSILLTLGFATIIQEAANCEQRAQSGDVAMAQASWKQLAKLLRFVLSSDALEPKAIDKIGL